MTPYPRAVIIGLIWPAIAVCFAYVWLEHTLWERRMRKKGKRVVRNICPFCKDEKDRLVDIEVVQNDNLENT